MFHLLWCLDAQRKGMVIKMRLEDIHIGDLLRVRDWADMQCKFGLLVDSVVCRFGFTSEMQYLCGWIFEVKDIEQERIIPSDMNMLRRYSGGYWNLSADMLAPFVPISAVDDFEDVDLSQFLEVSNET